MSSRKPEQKVNDRLRDFLPAALPDCQHHRTELGGTNPGWPDWVIFRPEARVVMLECKWLYATKRPLRDWTPKQQSFARNKTGLGVGYFVLVSNLKEWWLFDWEGEPLEHHPFLGDWLKKRIAKY